MFLFKFKAEEKEYYLHNGEKAFIGADNFRLAEQYSFNNVFVFIGLGGLTVVEKTMEEVLKDIGGIPYHIIEVSGGLTHRHFFGVPLIK